MKALRWMALGLGAAAGGYAAYAGSTWLRYGRTKPAPGESRDTLLDAFIPEFEVAERHQIDVSAPAGVTLATAMEIDINESGIVRALFKGRELFMGASSGKRERPRGFLEDMKSLGWSVLAFVPDREIVVGAVTRPWEPNVVFRSVPPGEFAAFNEPDYVKIVWTLRADPVTPQTSIARTETRVTTTDTMSRSKFRRYWSFASPGILIIRYVLLKQIKAQAEQKSNASLVSGPGTWRRV